MVMVSRCLAGEFCRYDGKMKRSPLMDKLEAENIEYILFCPECMGGLSTPREPAEIVGGDGKDVLSGEAHLMNKVGTDVTEEFLSGAKQALALAESCKPTAIYMKSRSPSCGKGCIYDGTFQGKLRDGNGVTAELLMQNGFEVIAVD